MVMHTIAVAVPAPVLSNGARNCADSYTNRRPGYGSISPVNDASDDRTSDGAFDRPSPDDAGVRVTRREQYRQDQKDRREQCDRCPSNC